VYECERQIDHAMDKCVAVGGMIALPWRFRLLISIVSVSVYGAVIMAQPLQEFTQFT